MATNFLQNYISGVKERFNAPPVRKNPLLKTSSPVAPTPTATSTVSNAKTPISQQYKSPVGPTPSANIGATSTYSSPITPSTATPKSQYVSSLTGGSDFMSTPAASTVSSPTTTTQPKSEKTAYLEYLTGIGETSRKSREESFSKLAEIQNKQEKQKLDARREYEEMLDRSGGLKGGARESAALSNRRRGTEAADIALEESAAARTAQVQQDLYESYLKENELANPAIDPLSPVSVGKDSVLVDPTTGKIIYQGSGVGSTASDTGSYTAGASPLVDSYIKGIQNKTVKISDVPDELQSMVVQGLSSQPTGGSETSRSVSGLVDQLLGMDTAAITGLPSLAAFVPGSSAQLTKNTYEQLKSMLSLQNRTLLKGSGAISDFEAKSLEKAGTKLGRNLSNNDFVKVLNELKTDLIKDQMRADGVPEDVIQQVVSGASFNSVGNTKVSIPPTSRLSYVNNNPGNLRFAGQTGAVSGEKGFAKFSSPQAGLQALQRQIELDASRGLTLAQFISKFAPPTENDTNQYIAQVQKLTGATANTPIKNININNLTKAIAQKESSTQIS